MKNDRTEADKAAVEVAGLEDAFRLFPEDVAAAAAEATALRTALATAPLRPEDEPWVQPR